MVCIFAILVSVSVFERRIEMIPADVERLFPTCRCWLAVGCSLWSVFKSSFSRAKPLV